MTRFPRIIAGALGVVALTAFAASSAGAAEITVVPWLAPNAFGSPSFAGAEANAVQAMLNGVTSYGTPGTPEYFEQKSNVTSQEVIVTGFNSWLGQVDPGTVFGAAFASELGNRMTFALRIDGLGSQFSISQLSFSATSTDDPYDALDFGFTGGYQYGSGYVGVLKGSDGILWTSDDVYVTSGLDTQLVDGLAGRGSGNSFAAYCVTGPPCPLDEQIEQILEVAAYPGFAFQFTGTYSIGDDSGSATFNISAPPSQVPLPPSVPLFATGIAALGWLGLRRRRRAAAA